MNVDSYTTNMMKVVLGCPVGGQMCVCTSVCVCENLIRHSNDSSLATIKMLVMVLV